MVPSPASLPGGAALRADAERNRLALLAAAREVFAVQGVEAPLEEVAARAGVGIATLYRRFPNRRALVAAALADQLARYLDIADHALAEEDPWQGFAWFVQQVCALQANDRGLGDLLFMALQEAKEVDRLRRLAQARTAALIERAKIAGSLRPDFVEEDVRLLLLGQAAVVRVTSKDAPDAWKRYVALMLDGFRNENRPELPGPPTKAQLARAMRRFAQERGCTQRSERTQAKSVKDHEATSKPPSGAGSTDNHPPRLRAGTRS